MILCPRAFFSVSDNIFLKWTFLKSMSQYQIRDVCGHSGSNIGPRQDPLRWSDVLGSHGGAHPDVLCPATVHSPRSGRNTVHRRPNHLRRNCGPGRIGFVFCYPRVGSFRFTEYNLRTICNENCTTNQCFITFKWVINCNINTYSYCFLLRTLEKSV